MAVVLAIVMVVVSMSLLVLAAYAGAFIIVAVHTAWRRGRPDPVAVELDQFLAEVLHAGLPRGGVSAGHH